MELVFSLCIAIFTGVIAYRNQNKRIKLIKSERDIYKNQVNRYSQIAQRSIEEAKQQKENTYKSYLWQADAKELVIELLKRTFDDGTPKVIAQCVTNKYDQNIVVGLVLNEKYKVE